MTETIKQIYNDITILFNSIGNSFIGKRNDKFLISNIKYSIDSALKYKYPYYNFNIKVSFDEHSYELKIDLDPDLSTFPKIGYKNYHTHNFLEVEKDDTYYMFPVLKCSDCNLTISENGNLIDGDFSCSEFTIKNLLE